MNTDDKEKVNPKSYVKKGFWISLGAVGGISLLLLSFIGIILIKNNISNVSYYWKTFWYSKEKKDFMKCWEKEYPIYMNAPLTLENGYTSPKPPQEICKEKGFKPFPPYDKAIK